MFEWKNEYSVGILTIDNQHRELVKMVNQLNNAMKEGKGKEVISSILRQLASYTINHFNYEEKLFAKYNYPDKDHHISIHEKLKSDVTATLNDVESGKPVSAVQLFSFLQNWLITHIQGEDKKYSGFLIEKGEK